MNEFEVEAAAKDVAVVAEPEMTDEDYLAAQFSLSVVAGILYQHNWTGFLLRIERAHAVGPIVDPTMYREILPSLEKVTVLARGAKSFMRALTPDVMRDIATASESLKQTLPLLFAKK